MPVMAPNDLPAELIVKILASSLGQVDELDAVNRRAKLALLKSCCLVSRGWVQVCQALLFRNVLINRTRTLFLFLRSLEGQHKLAKHIRQLSLGFPTWDDPSPLQIGQVVEKILIRSEGLEELELRPPFNQLINRRVIHRVNSLPTLKKLLLKWGHVVPIPSADRDQDMDLGSEDNAENPRKDDGFFQIVLPPTVQDLQLIQPPIEFMARLPKFLSNFVQLLPPILPDDEEAMLSYRLKPNCKLNTLSLRSRISDSNRFGRDLYRHFPQVLFRSLGRFSINVNSALDLGFLMVTLAQTASLEHLTLSQLSIGNPIFSFMKPLKGLRSLELKLSGAAEPVVGIADHELAWLNFAQWTSEFIAHSAVFDRFAFDAQLVTHRTNLSILLDAVCLATQDPIARFSRLKQLSVRHQDDLSADTVDRLCSRAPLLESLDIHVQIIDRLLIKDHLLKLKQLEKLTLNNLTMTKDADAKCLDTAPFIKFCEKQVGKKKERRFVNLTMIHV